MGKDLAAVNNAFLMNTLDRNYEMPNVAITQAGQVLDIELDSVPGWASSLDLQCVLNLAINVAGGGAAPSISPFAPWNIFREVQVSLGGGPFQRVSPFFYFLREKLSHGWDPSLAATTYAYTAGNVYNVPAVNAPAGATTVNTWRFPIRIPLQIQHGSIYGFIPMGTAAVKVKLRLTVTNNLYGADQYLSPLYGGANVTGVTIDGGSQSFVQPAINYRTTPAVKGDVANPAIGYVLNVQEKANAFVGAGALTPVKFSDPFKYLRLYMIVLDGTGAPNTAAVTNLELDLTPGYPQYNFATPGAMMHYFNRTRRKYQTDLPTGVFLFDMWSGSDPRNPNDTQIIDGTTFQTLQAQIAVAAATNVGAPARIISYAEALSPVGF